MPRTVESPVVVALDAPDASKALAIANRLSPELCRVKVGKELFVSEGPSIVEALQKQGFDVFLDLKFHDIPNTVAKAIEASARLGVWMVNVHASGGVPMMEAARESLESFNEKPLLIAVTVLTSMDQPQLTTLGVERRLSDQVDLLAGLAAKSGMDGVVCSAQEAGHIKSICGGSFRTVTPGIRPAGSDVGDQKRIMTPEQAVQAGSDWLVIGRPITQAQDPVAVLEAIQSSLRTQQE